MTANVFANCGREVSDGGTAATQTGFIGAAESAGNEPIPTVIERADAALYRAKQSGRNRVEMGYTHVSQQRRRSCEKKYILKEGDFP